MPSIVLVECLHGHPGRDALPNSFLKTCDTVEEISEPLAQRAALLRRLARRGSAVDALVVALAEPGGRWNRESTGDRPSGRAGPRNLSYYLQQFMELG